METQKWQSRDLCPAKITQLAAQMDGGEENEGRLHWKNFWAFVCLIALLFFFLNDAPFKHAKKKKVFVFRRYNWNTYRTFHKRISFFHVFKVNYWLKSAIFFISDLAKLFTESQNGEWFVLHFYGRVLNKRGKGKRKSRLMKESGICWWGNCLITSDLLWQSVAE